ncbi:MAG: MFS transporter [Candidatus Moranbacteria bacterium]|nr:MFS transporter [Candidatus Moranbacteria bacterium]
MSPHQKKKLRKINFTILALGFLDAFLVFILSAYISPITGEKLVGIFYLMTFIVVFFVLFFFHRIVEKLGQSRTLYFFLGMAILASVLLSKLTPSWLAVFVALLFLVAVNATYVALDVLLENFSEDSFSGRIRGMNLTLMNLGILLAPLLSVLALEDYGYAGVFFVLTLGYSLTFLYALLAFRFDNHPTNQKIEIFHSVRQIWREKNLRRIYSISFAMEFFYALMIVYMPLHLRSLGVSWEQIGVLFTVMLIPFVLVQYPLGLIADKRYGEKELLIISLAIALVATASLTRVTTPDIFLIGTLLFFSRVGIAGVEVLRDSFFYKHIDADDTDLIAFFRTTRSLANISAALVVLPLFIFFPIASFLYVTALMLFLGFMESWTLEDTK